MKTVSAKETPFRTIEKDSLLFSNREIAKSIETIVKEAGIKTREVNFSIPDFSTFFTNFELPPMSPKELPQAVRYEARSYIPLPLSEITLDWTVIEGEVSAKLKSPLKILVAAIPNEVINQYQEIAQFSNLKLQALEAEVFALARSSVRNEKGVVGLIDIGARSTTVNVLEKKILKISHSFNISGNELTEILSRSLSISYEEAEKLKNNYGLVKMNKFELNVREILLPLIDSIFNEIRKIFQIFYRQEGKEIEKIVLAGSSALLPGLKEYFAEEFQKEIEIANPFFGISSPPILDEVLKEIGPTYAIAIGLALKGLE
jgi:type IV pilus assembly protein PilM